jgi:stage V sporulation protein B
MKKNFFANTMILTLTSQLLSLIGVFFIAWLSGVIGTEGIGLYQLICSVYILAGTLAASGVGVTVSRLIAESAAKSNGRSTSDVLHKAVVISAALGLTVGLALYLLADFIGVSLLGDARTVLSIKVLAPGLPFMALSNCLRGYFIGLRNVIKPSGQMLFEQLVRISIVMLILGTFLPRGLEYACLAVILSCMISEALSCVFAYIMYCLDRRRSFLAVVPEKGITKKIVQISTPLALSSGLRAALRTAENILIPLGIKRHGETHADALSQFGRLGMVMPVLFFPSGFLTAIATLLLPEVAHANATGNTERIKAIFSRVFQMTVLMSLMFCAIFLSFADDFGLLIYHSGDIGQLLGWLAPLTPLIYLDFVVDSMLSGLGQQLRTLQINVLDYALRIGLILLLVPRFGLMAYILILYFSAMLNATLSLRRLLLVSRASIRYREWIIKPMLAAAISGSLVVLVFRLLSFPQPSALVLALKILLLAALYAALLFLTQSLSKGDMRWFKNMLKSVSKKDSPDIKAALR